MRFLMIDVNEGDVKLVTANGLDDYYDLIGCECIDIVRREIGGVEVEIILDDEGALQNDRKLSGIGESNQAFYGSLLIASGRIEGDGELTELTDSEIAKILRYVATASIKGEDKARKILTGIFYA